MSGEVVGTVRPAYVVNHRFRDDEWYCFDDRRDAEVVARRLRTQVLPTIKTLREWPNDTKAPLRFWDVKRPRER